MYQVLVLVLISLPAFGQEFKVSKSATLCKGENHRNCSYVNPSVDMTCEFFENGRVQIKKTYIGGMIGPSFPLPAPDRWMDEHDLRQLLRDVELARGNQDFTDEQIQHPKRMFYSLYGSGHYSIMERYRILIEVEGQDNLFDQFIGRFDSWRVERLMTPETERLMDLTDKYCQWDHFRKFYSEQDIASSRSGS